MPLRIEALNILESEVTTQFVTECQKNITPCALKPHYNANRITSINRLSRVRVNLCYEGNNFVQSGMVKSKCTSWRIRIGIQD